MDSAYLHNILPEHLKAGLLDTEVRLYEHTLAGKTLDLRSGNDKADDPDNYKNWPGKHLIRAEFLRWFCIDNKAKKHIDPVGIRIKGARIIDELHLAYATITHPLELAYCKTEEIILSDATTKMISLVGTHIADLTANGITTQGNLVLSNGFKAFGKVAIFDAKIRGSLICHNGTIENKGKDALIADRIAITGDINLNDGFEAVGEVCLVGAKIGGDLNCRNGSYKNKDGIALNADRIMARGCIFLDEEFMAEGEVRLLGAQIDGAMYCTRGKFGNPERIALNGDGINTAGGIFLNKGFKAEGMVALPGAQVGGSLSCTQGSFKNAGGAALLADGIKTTGSIFLGKGFEAHGEVSLVGSRIGQNLDCRGGIFKNYSNSAINANRIDTQGHIYLNHKFNAEGSVDLTGAKVGGNLDCNSGAFKHKSGFALSAGRAVINGSIILGHGFNAQGWINLNGSKIEKNFDCKDSRFENEGDVALTAQRMTIKGLFVFSPSEKPKGMINLQGTSVGQFEDYKKTWPTKGNLILNGFEYKMFHGDKTSSNVKERRMWLELQLSEEPKRPDKKFFTQPYEQLAKVYKNMGHESDARDIYYYKQEALRKYGELKFWRHYLNLFFSITVGHGWKPQRAVIIIFILLTLGCGVFWCANSHNVMEPASATQFNTDLEDKLSIPNTDLNYPIFNAAIYAFDTFVPVLDLKQEIYWTPDATKPGGWFYRGYLWLHIVLGWIFSPLLLTTLTGLIRKE